MNGQELRISWQDIPKREILVHEGDDPEDLAFAEPLRNQGQEGDLARRILLHLTGVGYQDNFLHLPVGNEPVPAWLTSEINYLRSFFEISEDTPGVCITLAIKDKIEELLNFNMST